MEEVKTWPAKRGFAKRYPVKTELEVYGRALGLLPFVLYAAGRRRG